MEQELNKYIGTDGIIEVQSRERSACKLLSTEYKDHSVILNFESIFPVRELNFKDVPDWNIELSRTAFGKNFTFIVDGQIEEPDNNTIRFTENERNLTVTIDFNESKVKETMLKYIDELIPKK
ncbi:hypothetical protein [Chryseobacterium sp. EO14]|uniref:hypothetical protein n=1 Tax=Chryseobacterium sp. EO14 TaxID=2950551 RepID=UPI00210E6FA6|nr:hypothetical protein [Chryseobacterium sp. EO14]MCQ4138655.1 hypothetical protein [Chryseobacterium sp. EO14]